MVAWATELVKQSVEERWERHGAQLSRGLTAADKEVINLLVDLGFQHKRIASLFDVPSSAISGALDHEDPYK